MEDAWDLYWLRLPKRLLREMGPIGASVFARMAGYCDMDQHLCYAAQETMAEDLCLSRATVNKWIKRLVRAGYVADLGPEKPGGPNRYDLITWDDHKMTL